MTPSKLQTYRKRLRELLDQVQGDAHTVREQARVSTGGQYAGGLSNVPMHLGDIGTDVYLQELNSALLENEEQLLGELVEAVRRVDAGTFGTCEECGKPIAEARLEALPYARHCVSCAERIAPSGRANLNVGRPHVETDTIAAADKLTQNPADDASEQSFGKRGQSKARTADIHAAGEAGGGTAVGGLAGSNIGRGNPREAELDMASGSGQFDAQEDANDDEIPEAGRTGGAAGGTPVGKRAGKSSPGGHRASAARRAGFPRRTARK